MKTRTASLHAFRLALLLAGLASARGDGRHVANVAQPAEDAAEGSVGEALPAVAAERKRRSHTQREYRNGNICWALTADGYAACIQEFGAGWTWYAHYGNGCVFTHSVKCFKDVPIAHPGELQAPSGLDGDARSGSRTAAPTPPPTRPPPTQRWKPPIWRPVASRLFSLHVSLTLLPAHRCLSFAIAVCNEAAEALSGSGDSGYRGCQTRTRSGALCQRWDSQSPNTHSRTHENHLTSGLTDNYCRNPDGEATIWCYTVDGPRFELCNPLPGVFLPRHRLGYRPR